MPDRGDSVCIKSAGYTCNPWHDWTQTIPVATIDKAFPSIGKLSAIKVTARNGYGTLGGRVETLQVVGTTGATLSMGVGEFIATLGLDSDWFTVTNGP